MALTFVMEGFTLLSQELLSNNALVFYGFSLCKRSKYQKCYTLHNLYENQFYGVNSEIVLYISFQLNIRINELENKRQFKCIYVNSRLKEEVRIKQMTLQTSTLTGF